MNTPLWLSNLLFWSIQVAVLALAAGLLARLLRVHQPRVLLGYWRALLAISLALPFVQPWHHLQNMATLTIGSDIDVTSAIRDSTPGVARWHFLSLSVIAQIFGLVIVMGIALRFTILAFGVLKLRQFRHTSSLLPPKSTAVFEGLRAHVNSRAEFRLSADVDTPVTFGFAAPVILLPRRFLDMDARFQTAIACHELMHVSRHDWAHHLAEELIRSVFWFHPAIVWLISRIRLAREQVVDLEVVRLTKARKTYLEALLEFATSRRWTPAVPAPPFLSERQLTERISFMLKEVHMSKRKIVASLVTIACCLTLAIVLAARTFPLKGAPIAAQAASAPESGVIHGVPGGLAGGIPGGVSGRVTGGITGAVGDGPMQGVSSGPASVDRNTIWTDTVKKGPMVRQVRGLGTLVRAEDSANLVARITLPELVAAGVGLNQDARVDTRKGLVKGHVRYINPTISNATVAVDVALDGALPDGVRAGSQVDATIDIEKLDNILFVGRPVHAAANSTAPVFRIVQDGTEAVRVTVKFGRSSVSTIEVLDGLQVGDKVILSDVSEWNNVDRIHLK